MTLLIAHAQNVRLSHVQKCYYSANATGIGFSLCVRISHSTCCLRTHSERAVDLSVNLLLLSDTLVACLFRFVMLNLFQRDQIVKYRKGTSALADTYNKTPEAIISAEDYGLKEINDEIGQSPHYGRLAAHACLGYAPPNVQCLSRNQQSESCLHG